MLVVNYIVVIFVLLVGQFKSTTSSFSLLFLPQSQSYNSMYLGFVDSNNRVFARVLEQGEIMVLPKGLVHFMMNVGDEPATLFGSFNSQNPGIQKIPSAVFGSGIDEELLQKAFGLSSKQIGTLRKKFDPKTAR